MCGTTTLRWETETGDTASAQGPVSLDNYMQGSGGNKRDLQQGVS